MLEKSEKPPAFPIALCTKMDQNSTVCVQMTKGFAGSAYRKDPPLIFIGVMHAAEN